MEMNGDRIRYSMPVASAGMKIFVEKCLKEDEFFLQALENPVRALKNSGLETGDCSFAPDDFSHFFGALARLKELIAEGKLEEITFESIFGKPAELYGASIRTMISHGYDKEWDNRDAFTEKQSRFSVKTDFYHQLKTQVRQSIKAEHLVNRQKLADIELKAMMNPAASKEMDWVAEETKKSETEAGMNTEWNRAQAHTEKRSEEYRNKHFENSGIGSWDQEEIVSGPLVNPVELEVIAARIDTFTQIVKERNR